MPSFLKFAADSLSSISSYYESGEQHSSEDQKLDYAGVSELFHSYQLLIDMRFLDKWPTRLEDELDKLTRVI